jgi:hypothetical protein
VLLLFLGLVDKPVSENAGISRPSTIALGADRSAICVICGTARILDGMKYASLQNIAALEW